MVVAEGLLVVTFPVCQNRGVYVSHLQGAIRSTGIVCWDPNSLLS